MVTIFNKQRTIPVNTERLKKSASTVMKELGYADFDLSILITNNKTIQFYNKTYRHKDVPTDILSFPYYKIEPGQTVIPLNEDEKNLGDIILSAEYINALLPDFNVSLAERLDTIIIHGICHLLGYSHYDPENDKIMIALEEKLARILAVAPTVRCDS